MAITHLEYIKALKIIEKYESQQPSAGKAGNLPLMNFLKQHHASGRLLNAIFHFLFSIDQDLNRSSVSVFCDTVSKKELGTIRNLGEVSRAELIRLLEDNGHILKDD